MPRLKGDLGPLERAVMEIVWDRDEEMSVRDLLEAPVGEGHAYTTLMTVLDRLWRKGYLVRRKVGRAYVYRSRLTREQHVENLVTQVLAGAKDRSGALLGFVRGVDEEDLADLRKAIRQVEQERRAGR